MKKIDNKQTVENLRNLIKEYILKSKVKSLVLGISGGIDSAIVAVLVKPIVDELGIPLIGRSITIESNSEDEQDRAREIGKHFCTDFQEVNLTEQYKIMKEFDNMEGDCDDDVIYKIRMGNIKARMRMIYLYNLASRNNGLVLGTMNESEHNLAYFTLCGDEAADFEPIISLWKTEIYDMASYLVDEEDDNEKAVALNRCILCNATDGLGISNTDLDQILPDWKNRHNSTRSGYEEVDNILIDYLQLVKKLMDKTCQLNYKNNLIVQEKVLKLNNHPVIKRYIKYSFKRNHPYIIHRNDIIKII